ncbi:MAG TPA: 5-formyltetrahydrofolate cyclo-ligase [Desulfobacterales bacterium]|nr:5-formyltetrahydrofolate cyclo-ligase [Desulfobacterales bacterium]
MEEIQEKKSEIRRDIEKILAEFSEAELVEKTKKLETRLFEFANFLEAKIVLLYMNGPNEVDTQNILKKCLEFNKIVVLPAFDPEKYRIKLRKVDNDADLKQGLKGILEPDPDHCKIVPIQSIDIAIMPGIAFDEKGGRLGSGEGYYDRLVPKLSITTRKVALAFECQIIQQVPMESHDKHVDIIITEERTIYKI